MTNTHIPLQVAITFSRSITAKIASTCPCCGEAISVGAEIVKVSNLCWIHNNCRSQINPYTLGYLIGFAAGWNKNKSQIKRHFGYISYQDKYADVFEEEDF